MASGLIGHTTGGHPIGAWILKANPAMWDIADWWETDEPMGSWRLADSARVDLVAPGQRCLLWITGAEGARMTPGIWAVGRITGLPYWSEGDLDDRRWSDRSAQAATRPFVPVDLRRLASPIARRQLREDPRFARSEILRAPRSGNPVAVTPDELAAVDEWIDRAERANQAGAGPGAADRRAEDGRPG